MGSRGAIIMSFFGAVFIALTLAWGLGISGLTLALPFVVFGAITLAAVRVSRSAGEGPGMPANVKRALIWSSTAEGIGLFIAENLVMNLGRPDLRLPVMALIVGLHFLPIAFAGSFRPFWILGVALIAVAVAGFVVPAPAGSTLSGIVAGFALWTASIHAIGRDRRTRVPSPQAA